MLRRALYPELHLILRSGLLPVTGKVQAASHDNISSKNHMCWSEHCESCRSEHCESCSEGMACRWGGPLQPPT